MKHRARRRVENEAGAIIARDQQPPAVAAEFENREPGRCVRHGERAGFLRRAGRLERYAQRAGRVLFPDRHERPEAAVGIGQPGKRGTGVIEIGPQNKIRAAEQEDGVVAELVRHSKGGSLARHGQSTHDGTGAGIMTGGVDLVEQPIGFRLLCAEAQRTLPPRLLLPQS